MSAVGAPEGSPGRKPGDPIVNIVQSPVGAIDMTGSPATVGGSSVALFEGSLSSFGLLPRAYARGYTLPPASLAR